MGVFAAGFAGLRAKLSFWRIFIFSPQLVDLTGK
jgi:hypothetical protein